MHRQAKHAMQGNQVLVPPQSAPKLLHAMVPKGDDGKHECICRRSCPLCTSYKVIL